MKSMKVLISPIGDPTGYSQVTYKLSSYEPKVSRMASAVIAENIRPDKIIFVVGDTLASAYKIVDKEYENIIQNIRKEVERFLTGELDSDSNNKYEITVAPAVGTFDNNSFTGEMLDYYHLILHHLASLLICDNTDIDMHIDITHGINYMSILCYRAVLDLLYWLALFYKVDLTVYNSDPVRKNDNPTNIKNINIIEKKRIIGRPLEELLSDNARTIYLNKDDISRKKQIDERLSLLKKMKQDINAFVGSIYNGLPLALYTFYNEPSDIKNVIDITLDIFKQNIVVYVRNGLNVLRTASFTNDFKICIYAYITSRLLKERYDIKRIGNDGIDMSRIEKIKEFFNYDERLETRIDKDIHDIKKNERNRIDDWTLLRKVVCKPIGEPDDRNFLAHSGFEENIIEIINRGGIKLRYNNDHLDTLRRKLSTKGLIMT
ncbi:MAG: CRISPR-associated CARF protein Csx1 [Candidatus Nitrosocaldus sp.]